MPLWSEVLREVEASAQAGNGQPDFDAIRRRYLSRLAEYTGRSTILYASGWLQKSTLQQETSIFDEDLHGFMEVESGIGGGPLDLILHSPGGSAETAEAIVTYLRARHTHLRVIVPMLAKSAATMIACAADEIVMGRHSFLGPTDPQLFLNTPLGSRFVPAQAILDQFDRASEECADPTNLARWLPFLSQVGPDLLVACEKSLSLSRECVATWLSTYMFRKIGNAESKAAEVSKWLASFNCFKSHGRHVDREQLRARGLVISSMEEDDTLQDLVLSVFHATSIMLSATQCVKIIENHVGRAYVKQVTEQVQPVLLPQPAGPAQPAG